ncbi:hypothetical protein PMAYCL1PPCAC_16093, partial [Pristionchus mayeri]
SSCGPGWTQAGKKCFKLIAAPNTWSVLDKICSYEGSEFASISSAAENEVIRSEKNRLIEAVVFPSSGLAGGREIYIGGLSYALGPWSWADRSPFGRYRNWATGFEPAISPYKPCIKMNSSGKWFNNCCRVPPAAGVCSKN